MKYELIATATFGLEAVVRREVEALGFDVIKTEDGRVTFSGDEAAIAKANLWLRAADRVYIKMGEFDELRLSTLRVKNETEIHVIRAVPVRIDMDGAVQEMQTARPTVGLFLKKLGIDREKYQSSLNDGAPIRAGLVIRLRTPEALLTEEQEASQEQLHAWEGGQYVETAHGNLRFTECLVMEASAYLPTDGSEEGITATGVPARYGIVAVDPDVIPLGTRLYIPGYGIALAADTGGMIEGDMIDLCMEDYDDCIQFGRRDIDVYILET